MSAICRTTHQEIKAYLEVFIENTVKEYQGRAISTFDSPSEYLAKPSQRGRMKPFHAAIIPPELMRLSEFERGFSTSLGTTFEECAKLIAKDHHIEAVRSYDVSAEVSVAAVNEIERQVSVFEHAAENKTARPTFDRMVAAVLAARSNTDAETRTYRADLYVRLKDGKRFFFEMKSPQPNKGQCLEVTQRLLRFHLLCGKSRPDVSAYFAMAYNPYGPSREDYRWSFAVNYTPFNEIVIIGQEFWNIIGGPTVYEELLQIYHEVGREKSKYMVDALAFGF